jgi:hypothetical protein
MMRQDIPLHERGMDNMCRAKHVYDEQLAKHTRQVYCQIDIDGHTHVARPNLESKQLVVRRRSSDTLCIMSAKAMANGSSVHPVSNLSLTLSVCV